MTASQYIITGIPPPLCGIVQLTNSAALRFRNWSFTINVKDVDKISVL